jgi:Sperm tail
VVVIELIYRYLDEDINQNRRLSAIHNEDIVSTTANASIIGKWSELKLKDIPHELEQEINQQLEECNKIIKSKDDLIIEFQRQLRLKDEQYINTLKKQVSAYMFY